MTRRRIRSGSMAAVRRMHAAAGEADSNARTAREVIEARATRREFLLAGGAAAVGAAWALSPLSAVARTVGRRKARIAIVGAGLAGLACARELARHGLHATLFEGNAERIGGRCWTLRDYFGGGIAVEHGGAFIDSDQWAIRRLARELGLAEEEVDGGGLPEGEEVFFDSEGIYTLAQATSDWRQIGYAAVRAAAHRARSGSGKRELDALSVPEWLEAGGIGADSRFGRLLQSSCVAEYGADPADQSSLNLLELVGGNPRSELGPLSGVDERFHIVGGNDLLVVGVAQELPPGTIAMGRRLIAIRSTAAGTPLLAFETGAVVNEATFDLVVLALPFTTLREAELGRSGMSAQKIRTIEQAALGTNAKVHVELTHKTWPELGYSGSTYGEPQGMSCGWDDCVQLGPGARPAVFCAFPGGAAGSSGLTGPAHGPAPRADVAWALGEVERVFPGTVDAAHGEGGEPLAAYEDHWALDPWVRGAYSYYRVGQAATFGRLIASRDGPYFFAGEHTAGREQGYLDGAVQSGERAAREVLRAL